MLNYALKYGVVNKTAYDWSKHAILNETAYDWSMQIWTLLVLKNTIVMY